MGISTAQGWRLTASLAFLSCALVSELARAKDQGEKNNDTPPIQRTVSLTAEGMARRAALKEVCRQAGLRLQWDFLALEATNLKPDELLKVTIAEEPLPVALGQLINWSKYPGVFYQIQGDDLHVSTMAAKMASDQQHLPDWIKERRQQGLHGQVDYDGNVDQIHAGGKAITDDLFARFATLPKLRKLHLSSVNQLTAEGLRTLSKLSNLEELELHSTDGLGDAALQALRGHKSLQVVNISECGTTDEGVRLLRELPQLNSLTLRQEGRLTDASISSIAMLKQLKSLDLTSHVSTEKYGWMRFSNEALGRLSYLRKLETLTLPGNEFPVAVLPLPRIRLLTLSGPILTDDAVLRLAQCSELRSLAFEQTNIRDDDLKPIADLKQLNTLYIRGGNVTDAGLEHLTKLPRLTKVDLYRLPITEKGIAHLAQIKTLTRIDLGEANVDAIGLSSLNGLPRLRTLWLRGQSDPMGFAELKALTQLRELHFEMCTINQQQYDLLESVLPDTRITAGNGGGFLRSSKDKGFQPGF